MKHMELGLRPDHISFSVHLGEVCIKLMSHLGLGRALYFNSSNSYDSS